MKSIQHWPYINKKISIMAGLTSIREVAALISPTRITYKLNKDTFFVK